MDLEDYREADADGLGLVSEAVSPYRQDLGERTKQFALRIIRLYAALPNSTVAQVIGKQILRSGTSVGAQYREAIRARTIAEFTSKMHVGLQELEETRYWLELLVESETMGEQRLEPLKTEATELIAIIVTCIKNANTKR